MLSRGLVGLRGMFVFIQSSYLDRALLQDTPCNASRGETNPRTGSKRARSKETERRSSSPPRRRPSTASRPSIPAPSQHNPPHSIAPSVSPVNMFDLPGPSNPTPPFPQNTYSPHDHLTQISNPEISSSHDSPWGPIRDSIFGSARTALEGAGDSGQPWLSGLFSRRVSFDFSLPENQAANHLDLTPQHSGSFGPSPSSVVGNNGALGMLAATSTANTGSTAGGNAQGQGGLGQMGHSGMMGVNMGGMGGDRFVSPLPLPKSSD